VFSDVRSEPATVYLGIGSNIEPERNVPRSLDFLRRHVILTAVSTFYLTEPLGAPGTPPFFNGVVSGTTELDIPELRRFLQETESELGRVRTEDKYAPRTLDVDLLLYDAVVAEGEGWRIPHPEISTRSFVAIPLQELAPDLVLPDSGRPLREVAAELPPISGEPLGDFSESLKLRISRR
jgi:dihydroneopterin aldolase/2-amino-4-hydroxy-6-hydroxymethyldihydropteridine diphosphokinase